jgi:hypothetical protein
MTDVNGVDDGDSATLADLLSESNSIPSSSSTTTYLADLTSFTLPNLRSKPTKLSSTSAQLTNALTTFCTESYLTFLPLHSSSSSLSTTLSLLSSILTSLLATLPALQSSVTTFTSTAAPLLEERRHALLVRDKAGSWSTCDASGRSRSLFGRRHACFPRPSASSGSASSQYPGSSSQSPRFYVPSPA